MTTEKQKWTNVTLDNHLRERGFIKNELPSIITGIGETYLYTRDKDEIVYVSYYNDGREPFITLNGYPVDPALIGYRNTLIQNDNSPDE